MTTDNQNLGSLVLESAIKRFKTYKQMAESAMAQLTDEQLCFDNNDANSIAIIVKHMSGNMISRWTNFLTEDGEKSWRERDAEFQADLKTAKNIMEAWEKGWDCLLKTLEALNPEDMLKDVMIRNEPLNVVDAINRQLTHYAYHVGQIVYIAKALKGKDWKSLSIAPGESQKYNDKMFGRS